MELYLRLLRDYIGALAPLILFILSLFLLRNKTTYLRFFVGGFILNNMLNILLKLAIKEPRPDKDQKLIEIAVANGNRISFDKFGMPSGHAQNTAYCLMFITMALHNPFITGLYLIFTIISLFQRYLYNNHNVLQLITGLIIGLIVGYLLYWISNKYITGNIKMKKDENGPL